MPTVTGVDHVHMVAHVLRNEVRRPAMACRLSMVSSSDSPLEVDEVLMLRFTTSADSRVAAISKVVRVRVESSKNRLNTERPRSSGTFLISRLDTFRNDAALSRI